MLTFVPPFRHVPGLMVRLGVPPEVAECALHGCVVVVVVLAVVVVVVVVLVVLVVVVVVVVVPPPPPLEKLMGKVA